MKRSCHQATCRSVSEIFNENRSNEGTDRPLEKGIEGFEDTVLKREGFALPFQYPRADSNRNRQNRNLKSYPLDYGGKSCKVIHFCGESYQYVGKFQ